MENREDETARNDRPKNKKKTVAEEEIELQPISFGEFRDDQTPDHKAERNEKPESMHGDGAEFDKNRIHLPDEIKKEEKVEDEGHGIQEEIHKKPRREKVSFQSSDCMEKKKESEKTRKARGIPK